MSELRLEWTTPTAYSGVCTCIYNGRLVAAWQLTCIHLENLVVAAVHLKQRVHTQVLNVDITYNYTHMNIILVVNTQACTHDDLHCMCILLCTQEHLSIVDTSGTGPGILIERCPYFRVSFLHISM